MPAPTSSFHQATIIPMTTPEGKKSNPIHCFKVTCVVSKPSPMRNNKINPMVNRLPALAIQRRPILNTLGVMVNQLSSSQCGAGRDYLKSHRSLLFSYFA